MPDSDPAMKPSRRPTARISIAAGIAPSATPRLKVLIGSVASVLSAPSRYSPARPPMVMAIGGAEPATDDATASTTAFRRASACSVEAGEAAVLSVTGTTPEGRGL